MKTLTIKSFLSEGIHRAIKNIGLNADDLIFSVEPPANVEYGDYATNAALLLSSQFKRSPHGVAQEILRALDKDDLFNNVVYKKTVAGPGFVNFYISSEYLAKQIKNILENNENFGRSNIGQKKKVQIEFISANPTGPLTLGNGRGGFLGDALANVLDFVGYDVSREFYVNDTGEQIKKLGWSIIAAGKLSASEKLEIPYKPEELYAGGYIQEMAYKMGISKFSKEELDVEAISRSASKMLLEDIKRVVKKSKIHFDVWFSEKSLHRQGLVKTVLEEIQKKGLIEKKDGATWLKIPDDPQTKERVLIKSSGEATYLLSDITYHYDKFKRRRFNKVIDIFGADHHATAKTLLAALSALKWFQPVIILMQLVRLIEDGQEVRMSKRTGTFITLEELIDTVGLDAARFFFLMREPNSHMDFDLNLAKERSDKNPVYYVQYAHARASSIIEKAKEEGLALSLSKGIGKDFIHNFSSKIEHPSELSLIKKLIRLPEILEEISQNNEVSRLPYYATELAAEFSAFYRDCHVIVEDKELSKARLALVCATRIVLANTLKLMGIYAPQRM
ncbi:MAG: Arginine-tRNA ligase [Parcubacteria group bacterium GW2011_GWB1_40_14]|nr:MAG: Arginine-tRNA ligase [Parcubacteria group bacterium GW2011_GWB1_40_14]